MVEVRFFSLEVGSQGLLEHLSADELERASRFYFDRDRERFVVCRGTLRRVLGAELDADPAAMRFEYGAYGKPVLVGSDLQFNVSHSHGVGMIAVSREGEVGCDVERVDPAFMKEQIPERFFAPTEVTALRSLPVGSQCERFFRIWTRKEAFIKACGMGVSLALDSFDVTRALPDGWSVKDVSAPEGFAAAVVARGEFTISLR
jgi:4'-phosphopantetheinyl transferase